MAIKIAASLEPANDSFKVAHANVIEYRSSKAEHVASVEDALVNLENTVFALPKLFINSEYLEYSLDPGDKLDVPIYISTLSSGMCSVTVMRRVKGSSALFTHPQYFKNIPASQPYTLELGTISQMGSYEYRITATDGMNKPCEYYIGSYDNEEDAIQQSDGMVVTVKCGTVSFRSPFMNIAAATVWLSGVENNTVYSYECQYANPAKKLNIDIKILSSDNENIYSDNVDISTDYIAGTLLKGDIPINFTPRKTEFHTLTVIFTPIIDSEGNADSESVISYTYLLDVMAPETVVVTDVTDYPVENSYTSNDYISIRFIPKTSVKHLTGPNQLTVNCSVVRIMSDGTTTPIQDQSLIVSSSVESSWNIGNLFVTDEDFLNETISYAISITPQLVPGSVSNVSGITARINVYNEQLLSEDYVKSGLKAYFEFNSKGLSEEVNGFRNLATRSTDNPNPDSNLVIVVNGGNASDLLSTCSVVETEYTVDGEERNILENFDVLSLQGKTYAQTKRYDPESEVCTDINPWTSYTNIVGHSGGFTLETKIKTTRISELESSGIHIRRDDEHEIVIGNRSSYIQSKDCAVDLIEDKWHHLVFVVNPDVIKDTTKTSDINLVPTTRIYVDGVLTKVVTSTEIKSADTTPLLLNAFLPSNKGFDESNLEKQGNTSIQFLRLYDRALSSSEVYNNFYSTLSDDRAKIVDSRNGATVDSKDGTDNTTNKIIYFIPNVVRSGSIQDSYYKDNSLTSTIFSELHRIDDKEKSKKTLVNCTMCWYDDNKWNTEDDVDVYLQGTSSLKYPVKNYQIRVFETVDDIEHPGNKIRQEKDILPPFIKRGESEWYTSSNVYTLKCDYMEESHRNNTPTANYYQDSVIDAVVDFCADNAKKIIGTEQGDDTYEGLSVARKIVKHDVDKNIDYHPYRDAIAGFPCIVYYTNSTPESFGTDSFDMTSLSTLATYAGSYMFNVDKEGKQLGFELEQPNPQKVYYYEITTDDSNKRHYTKTESNHNCNFLPCVSYEGATNSDYSAATFVPYLEHKDTYYTGKFNSGELTADKSSRRLYFRKVSADGSSYVTKEKSDEVLRDDSAYKDFKTVDELVTYINTLESKEEEYNKELPFKVTESGTEVVYRALFDIDIPREYRDEFGTTEYEYIKKTLKPRFSYTDKLELTSDEENKLKYSTIQRAIDWVFTSAQNIYSASSDEQKQKEIDNFRLNFKDYFSFEYCLAYYLQMMVFTQIDNAGKNAMFDTWGDGRLYPRPYDMDSQMGLDNSGQDNKLVSSELNLDTSPVYKSADFNSSTYAYVSDAKHPRFKEYNTSESFLWRTFGICFEDEIKDCYAYLRSQQVYNADKIQEYVNKKTKAVIGEKFYNDDAVLKYLQLVDKDNQPVSTFYYCINGNRSDRYYNFLKDRLVFLDTLYEYNRDNTRITLRANKGDSDEAIVRRKFTLIPLTPQYVTLEIDQQSKITTLVSPDDIVYDDDNNFKSYGVEFSVPISGNDKNIYLYGSHNIDSLVNLPEFHISVLLEMGNAKNIRQLDLSSSSISQLTLGKNLYITKLDLSNCESLTGSLDLSGCTNLEYLDVSNTKITDVSLPQNSPLSYLNCSRNTRLTSLNLNNLKQLSNTNINLEGCTSLTSISIIDCPAIRSTIKTVDYNGASTEVKKQLKANYFPLSSFTKLESFTVSGCSDFKLVELDGRNLKKLSLSSDITSLSMRKGKSKGLSELALSTLNNLEYLDLYQFEGPETKLLLPINSNDSHCGFNTLNLSHSSLSRINSDTAGNYDFTGVKINQNSTLLFNDNKAVQSITGLVYSGSLYSLFSNCLILSTLDSCKLTATSNHDSAQSMFYSCSKISTFTDTSIDLTAVKSIAHIFSNCSYIDENNERVTDLRWPSVRDIIKTAKNCTSYDSILYNTCINIDELVPSVISDKAETIKSAFAHCNVKKLAPKLFSHCVNLRIVTSAFGYNKNLLYVPEDLLYHCNKITDASSMFFNCIILGNTQVNKNNTPRWEVVCKTKDEFQNLSDNGELKNGVHYCDVDTQTSWTATSTSTYTKDSTYHPPCILTRTGKVFADNCDVKYIDAMFYNCSSLSPLTDSTNNTLNEFFSNLNSLETCRATFKDCSSFNFTFAENTTQLVSSTITAVDGLLSGSGIEKLPPLFRGNYSNLRTARGVFSGCTKLDIDSISDDFFTKSDGSNSCPNLTHIGAGKLNTVSGKGTIFDGGIIYLSGMFSNVASINEFDLTALNKLSSLTDCSALFLRGRFSGANITPVTDDATINITNMEDWSSTTVTNISYMFAGIANIYQIPYQLFQNHTSISTIEGIFSDCSELSTIMGADAPVDCLTNLPHLSDASWAFSNTKLSIDITSTQLEGVTHRLFKGCSSLISTSGMFFNSNISGDVCADIFDDCRDTLSDTSYMFACCTNLSSVKPGKAIVNAFNRYYSDVDDIKYYYDNNTNDIVNSNYTYIKETKDGLTDCTVSSYESFQEWLSIPSTESSDLLSNWFGSGKSFDRYLNYIQSEVYNNNSYKQDKKKDENNSTDITYTKINNYADIYDSLSSIDTSPKFYVQITGSGTSEISYEEKELKSKLQFYIDNKKVDIIQKGLLSYCKCLSNVKYMFAGCTSLTGAIPADMFYLAGSAVTSLEGLFFCCYQLTCDCRVSQANNSYRVNLLSAKNYLYSVIMKDETNTIEEDYIHNNNISGNYREIYPVLVSHGSNIFVYDTAGDISYPKYFVPSNWISNFNRLSSVKSLFGGVGVFTSTTEEDLGKSISLKMLPKDHNKLYCALEVPNDLFSNQYSITDADNLFIKCKTIMGSEFSSTFLKNSLTGLTSINNIFKYAAIRRIDEKLFLNSFGTNNTLDRANQSFTDISWNGQNNISTDTQLYHKIMLDTGLWGSSNQAPSLSDYVTLMPPQLWDSDKYTHPVDSSTLTYTFSNTTWKDDDVPSSYKMLYTDHENYVSITYTKADDPELNTLIII